MSASDAEPARSVFVTVGTDHHPFDRLISWVDEWLSSDDASGVRGFAQHGTSRPPTVAAGSAYLGHDEMEVRTRDAAAIVCHGGPGTIIDCLRSGTKPIVVPRRHALGEHVDDHQVRFARRLEEAGYIHVATTPEDLRRLLTSALAGAPEFVAVATEDQVRASVERFALLVDPLLPVDAAPVRILYIGGWGRSGSTLVDRLLGQVPGFVSVGEMRDIWLRGVIEDRLCGCGEPFRSCGFWSKVGDVAFGGWDAAHAREIHGLRMRFDRPWTPPLLAAHRVHPRGLDRYVDATARVYRAIQEVSGAEAIVDSTKIPSYALVLDRVPGFDVRFAHLVRDSRGVVHSWKKSVTRPDATDRPDRMLRYGSASASARYLLYNWTAGLISHSRIPYLFLRYEDVVADPAAHVARLSRFAGLGDVPTDFLEGDSAVLAPTHSVDGNPMRFTKGPLSIRADEEWRVRMDERDRRIVSALTRPLLRRYGYR